MNVRVVCFGHPSKGRFSSARLEGQKKITGQFDFLAKEGSTGMKQNCFGINFHRFQSGLSSQGGYIFIDGSAVLKQGVFLR